MATKRKPSAVLPKSEGKLDGGGGHGGATSSGQHGGGGSHVSSPLKSTTVSSSSSSSSGSSGSSASGGSSSSSSTSSNSSSDHIADKWEILHQRQRKLEAEKKSPGFSQDADQEEGIIHLLSSRFPPLP